MKKLSIFLMMLCLACFGVANAQSLWSENFEGGSMPSGWTTDGSGSWSVATAVNSTHPSSAGEGTYCAQIKHGTSGAATKLITPEIDLSSVNSAELSFMHAQQSWSGDIDGLKVYYRTSSSGTWTQLVEYTDAYASWTTESGIVLPNLSSTYQIAFEHIDNWGYGLGIDDINIVRGASCPAPAGLAVTNNGTTATLTWNSDATQFDVAWSLNPNADPDDYIDPDFQISGTTGTMSSMALDTDYYFWVRANCSANDQSSWAGPVSVHIGYCVPAPTSVDNNGISNVTFGIGNNVVNNDTPKATYANYSSQIGAVQAGVEASIAITFKTGYTYNTYVWADLNNDLTFGANEVICYGESGNTNPTTLTLNFTIPATQTTGDYRMRIGSADSGLGSDPNAADPCYSSSYGCFQDYTLRVLEAPSCLMPTGLAATNDGQTATVTWNGTAANNFIVTVNGGTPVTNQTSPYTFNVTASTTYEVVVEADCGGGETSDPVSTSFTTPCLPQDMCSITLALTDSYADGWNGGQMQVVDANTSEVYGTYTIESGGSATYELALCPGTVVNFVYTAGSYGTENGWVIYDAAGEVITEEAGCNSGCGHTNGVQATYTMNCSGCFKPTNLAETNVEYTTATLSWSGRNDGYVLEYRPWHQVGEDQIVSKELVPYNYDLSEYSGNGAVAIRHYDITDQFRLAVDNIVVTNAAGTVIYSEDFEDGVMPSNITNMDLDGDGNVWAIVNNYDDAEGNPICLDNYCAFSESYNNNLGALTPDNWMIISGIELGGSITFYARGTDAEWAEENMAVYVCADADIVQDSVATTSYNATGLEPNTPYAWQVKGICGEEETIYVASFFKTLDDAYVFTTTGNWNDANNWLTVEGEHLVPTVNNNVRIDADATIPSGVVAYANKVKIGEGTLTIQDGGQLKQNAASVQVTMEKVIAGYGEDYDEETNNNANYYFIASPFSGRTQFDESSSWNHVEDMLTAGEYDLYAFDATAADGLEWINYKNNPSYIAFQSGGDNANAGLIDPEGYLYANEEGTTLHFVGKIGKGINFTKTKEFTFDNESTDDWNGWALVGNSFSCNAYINYVDGAGNVLEANFYTLNNSNTYSLSQSNVSLAPCSGALIKYSTSGKVQFSTEAPAAGKNTGMINMNLVKGNKTVDQARVRFGEGFNLEHKSFRNNSKVYMPVEGNDYAVVYTEEQGEMPVNFKAEENGSYTLSFNTENVSFGYLHLIDNMTGNDVDLLATPSYSFNAKTTDYESRFKLVFATGNNDNDAFAFYSNGSFVINNEGEATLQVIDINGRIMMSESINGCANVNVNAAQGIYMLRLVNGDNVKVQKVVVR